MQSKRYLLLLPALFTAFYANAQLQIDKQIQLTGATANDRRITGLGTPTAATDAVSVANVQNNAMGYVAATNSGNAYSVSLAVAPASYTAGLMVTFKTSAANTGAATLNINGLGAKNILKYANQALIANDLANAQMVMVMYDGASFQMLNPTPGFTGSLAGDVTGTQGATQIASGVVGSAEITDGSIANADIANSTITPAKLSASGATTGQVITYDGTNVTWGAVGGNSIAFNRVAKVANAGNTSYTATIADGIVAVDMSAGTNFTVNLPSGVPSGGIIIVKIEKFNNSTLPVLTIVPAGSGKTIDGTPNVGFGNAGGNRSLYSDGAGNWYGW